MTDSTVRATAYLQVQPEMHWNRSTHDTAAGITGAKIVASTQGKPIKPKPGTVEVKVTIEIPKGAFLPLRPEAIVVIPADLTTPHPVTVTASDPESDS